jgi:acyl carrier protein
MKDLLKIVADISDERNCIATENADLITDLAYDSLKFVQLLSEIEDAFHIEFDIDEIEIEKLRSMQMLKQLIGKKVSEKENG